MSGGHFDLLTVALHPETWRGGAWLPCMHLIGHAAADHVTQTMCWGPRASDLEDDHLGLVAWRSVMMGQAG